MDFELAMTEPCQRCGTRDEEWRDYDAPRTTPDGRTVYPLRYPPPYVAEGIRCVGCAERAGETKALADGRRGELEPGVSVVLRRWDPKIDEAGED
ncbi:MAG: hypothetical protein LC798_16820 [Chloroflexi bacterium]|nr:hypothetical protein [Chloroflexota bacterium]